MVLVPTMKVVEENAFDVKIPLKNQDFEGEFSSLGRDPGFGNPCYIMFEDYDHRLLSAHLTVRLNSAVI